MTKETLATLLDGREYSNEITKSEEAQAKAAGLVVVFGYSDDNVEFRGAINDEAGAGEQTRHYLHQRGLLDEHGGGFGCECRFCGFKAARDRCAWIDAKWGAEGYSWVYATNIPHSTFEIMEDGEKFCRGIVFNLSDLPTAAA